MAKAIGGIAQGIGSAVAASEQAKAEIKMAKMQIASNEKMYEAGAADRERYSEQVEAEGNMARDQLRAAEEARLRVTSMLGAPGTYGASTVPTQGLFGMAPSGLGGMTGTGAPGAVSGGLWGDTQTVGGEISGEDVALGKKAKFKGSRKWEMEGNVMDPEAMAAAVTSQPAFAAVSGMVAEANQLMNREGPLWNELNNSVVGGIYEGAAAMQRQQMEEVARMTAAGGKNQRAGLAMARRFQVQENVNRQRSSQLWQSKMALEQYRTKAAQQNISFAQDWVSNQAGIRDTFTAALTNLRTFWSTTIPAVAIPASAKAIGDTQSANQQANSAMQSAQNAKGNAMSGALEGVIGAVTGGYGDFKMGQDIDNMMSSNPDLF